MNQKERLVDALDNAFVDFIDFANRNPAEKTSTEFIADYLLEQGVIVPPCKVGQTVYCIVDGMTKVMEGRVRAIWILEDGSQKFDTLIKGFFPQRYTLEDFGKTVFLTKEEAEQALKGGEG